MSENLHTKKIKTVLSGSARRDCLQVRKDGMRQRIRNLIGLLARSVSDLTCLLLGGNRQVIEILRDHMTRTQLMPALLFDIALEIFLWNLIKSTSGALATLLKSFE